MSALSHGADHRERAVRKMLDDPHPPVPPRLTAVAAARGRRMIRRRLLLKTAFWALLLATLVGLAVWAGVSNAWVDPPAETTPEFDNW